MKLALNCLPCSSLNLQATSYFVYTCGSHVYSRMNEWMLWIFDECCMNVGFPQGNHGNPCKMQIGWSIFPILQMQCKCNNLSILWGVEPLDKTGKESFQYMVDLYGCCQLCIFYIESSSHRLRVDDYYTWVLLWTLICLMLKAAAAVPIIIINLLPVHQSLSLTSKVMKKLSTNSAVNSQG